MDLFGKETEIDGLEYIPNFISEDEEAGLVGIIDTQEWLTDLKRRVQHYGWKYDYKARSITKDLHIADLPYWLTPYSKKLQHDGFFEKEPEQVIINEYELGQGIAPHIDIAAFGGVVASLSLGSNCIMNFTKDKAKESLLLEPRSLVILSGDARYKWKHSIPARKNDKHEGVTIPRSRRLSLTFRTVST